MPRQIEPNPVTVAVATALGLHLDRTVDLHPKSIDDDHVTFTATVVMPREEYELILERHRPKTAAEELAELVRLGGLRRDQMTTAEATWFAEHPMRQVGLDLVVAGKVADWLREHDRG